MVLNPIDVHIGSRVQKRRKVIGMSLETLAEGIGITPQLIRRYEQGGCRVGASRLYHLSVPLRVPISYFLEGLPAGLARSRRVDPRLILHRTPRDKRAAMRLINEFFRVTDQTARKHILDLLTDLGPPDKAEGHNYRPRRGMQIVSPVVSPD